jgi:hypothetical protein
MKKLIYILAILFAASAYSANDYVPLVYQTNTDDMAYSPDGITVTNLAEDISTFFAPSYGSFISTIDPFLVAESVSVTNGTISSGSVTNTWFEDQSYLVVNESGVWEVYFTFHNGGTAPRLLTFHGRYEGNASHDVKFQAYDQTNSVWVDFTPDADDLPSGGTDSTLQFTFPDPAINYTTTNGISLVKVYQSTGVAIGGHNIYFDFMQLTFATAVAEFAGVWYDITGGDTEQQNNMTMVPSLNHMITTSAGDYEWKWYMSFTGATDTEFHVRNLTNGVPTEAESIRTIGSEPSIGSMSAFGGGRLPSGATNSYQWKASTDEAWIAFVSASAKLKKEAN